MINQRATDTPQEFDAASDMPTHVAIIMDGNGRWAQARACPGWSATGPVSRPSGASLRLATPWG